MAVQNIECQIATVLMKRFLDGDNLPQNLLDDLEKHLKVCPSCKAVLQNESADIEEVLDGVMEPKGVSAFVGKFARQPAMAGGFVTAGAGQALMQASVKTYAPQAPGMAALKNPKVLFLSLSLAAVLIVMSTLLKNPTQFLGSKANAGNLYTETKEEKPTAEEHATDEKATGEKATDEHAAEPETHGAEEGSKSEDPAATTDEHAATPDTNSGETHHEEGSEPKSNEPNPSTAHLKPDPRVPGQPTLDQNDLIIAGGKSDNTHKTETKAPTGEQKKTTTTTAHQTTKPPVKAPSKATAKKPVAKRPRTQTRRPTTKKSTGSSKPSGGGIKVYDANGKPIH